MDLRVLWPLATAIGTSLSGCGPRLSEGGFDSPEPGARLYAIQQAAASRDPAAIPHLIKLLESDDPLVRMLSIRTLERITGQTMGFDYTAPQWERDRAIEAWVAWYAASGHEGAAGSGGSPAPGAALAGPLGQ